MIRNGSIWISAQLFDQLVLLNGKSNGYDPGLARSWQTSRDRRTWIFTLRDAAFSDFPHHAIGVGVDAVKGRAVESGAKALGALLRAQKVEALVCVLREHKT